MIELYNIVKTFKANKENIHAVNNVSLTINDGEIYGIIGYSGAGKSTLIRLINQLEVQTAGDVIINGVNFKELSPKELRLQRQQIGMIFQHFNLLWSRTVAENIELPLEFAHVPKAERKQRVGIARALANSPRILLCDEATSALDPDTTEQILELLREINMRLGITIVMITHQMEVVQKICTRMAVMSDGNIVEEGTVKQLFEHPKHAVTRRFVQNIEANQTIEELAESLKEKYPSGKLLRLSFTGNNAEQPTIINAARLVPFEISIVESNISQSSVGPMGVTYIHISGGVDSDYNKFVTYLTDNNVIVEVL